MATTGCSDDTPPTDNRCDDPEFREANPELCALHPVLILQPSYAITEPGSTVTYKVILRANGAETELTLGLSWELSNYGAAVINAEGVATGVSAGQTAVSVSWQDLVASAQLDVVGSCAETNQNFRILIDNSKSMSQGTGGLFGSKLNFSKSTAADFTDTINYSKDQVAVSEFGNTASEVQAWTTDAAAARSAINGISSTTEKTNLADALNDAIEGFDGQTGTRVIVIFTDGEWTGSDPKPIANQFKESGGFICVVAVRAWGTFFVDLLAIASDGFLLSAYSTTFSTILDSLSGLKSFLCSGGCSPEPGTAPMAQLNYTGYINWDVSRVIRNSSGVEIDEIFPDDPSNPLDAEGRPAGFTDLVGLDIYDVQPGNGLYVDLQGTAAAGHPEFGHGRMTSKESYDFEAGKEYSFEISMGTSLPRPLQCDFRIRITCGNEIINPTPIVVLNSPLTPTLFEWTQAGDFTGPIIIEQIENSVPIGSLHNNVGTLIDEITLHNVTDNVEMLYDNFDSENPTTVEPGTYSAYGCLETPPGTQQAEPQPPSRVIE